MNKMFEKNSEKTNQTIFFKFQEKVSALNVDCNYIILGKTTILTLSYRGFYSVV